MVNLNTLKENSKAMYKDYWDGRKYNISNDSKYANRSYVVLATENNGRLNVLAEKLKAQDIEIYKNDKPITVLNALKQNGLIADEFIIPPDSMIIPNNQPEAPLISAILPLSFFVNNLPLSVLTATSPTTRSLVPGSLPLPLFSLMTFAMSYNLLWLNKFHHQDRNQKQHHFLRK